MGAPSSVSLWSCQVKNPKTNWAWWCTPASPVLGNCSRKILSSRPVSVAWQEPIKKNTEEKEGKQKEGREKEGGMKEKEKKGGQAWATG